MDSRTDIAPTQTGQESPPVHQHQLVPAELLARANKVLFIAHLALGDYTYLQNFFEAFARAYPHIEVHLWVDEVRRTAEASKWESLRKYSLYDWVQACPWFAHVYTQTYSPQLFEESVRQAQAENYPLVVSIATLRPPMYAELARRISPQGFVAGMQGKTSWLAFFKRLSYRKLDAAIPPYSVDRQQPAHISAVYASWFRELFGLDVPESQRFPFVRVPTQWKDGAAKQLAAWGADAKPKRVFINTFAKTKKRCWPLESAAALVQAMRKRPEWKNAAFILNAMPQDVGTVRAVMDAAGLADVHIFSAVENFFQLPAMLARCDLIISVETAVMHLANAVHVPVIALMRQKNPEWVPIDREHSTVITAARRRDWVQAIPVDEVMKAI